VSRTPQDVFIPTCHLIETKIAGLTEDSYLWKDLPLPLPFLSTAIYQLQVRPQQEQEGATTSDPGQVIASSHVFVISPHDGNSGNNSSSNGGGSSNANPSASDPSSPQPSATTIISHSGGHHDSNAAIAAGLVVPIVVGISVAVFIFMQKRQTRILEERRKAREGLVID
jgi:hypothetical protein